MNHLAAAHECEPDRQADELPLAIACSNTDSDTC